MTVKELITNHIINDYLTNGIVNMSNFTITHINIERGIIDLNQGQYRIGQDQYDLSFDCIFNKKLSTLGVGLLDYYYRIVREKKINEFLL